MRAAFAKRELPSRSWVASFVVVRKPTRRRHVERCHPSPRPIVGAACHLYPRRWLQVRPVLEGVILGDLLCGCNDNDRLSRSRRRANCLLQPPCESRGLFAALSREGGGFALKTYRGSSAS